MFGGRNRTLWVVLAGSCILPGSLPAQPAPEPDTTGPTVETIPHLGPDELDRLVGPIALYPDPLIAQVLPASTYPIDVVRAARLVRAGGTDQIDQQNWDPSVKAIARYPDVIEMMDSNLDWTQQLGQAFIAQPDDVMEAVQRLRVKARGLGNLPDTPQEQVLLEDDAVRILPANPEVIYVPAYDPSIIYYNPPPVYGGFITFGFGFPCGPWLDLDCDWHSHWCYRPGWTWNHWHDNIVFDHGRITRFTRGFEFHPGVRPPTAWRRNPAKPITFPGRRLTHPSAFDPFRGRDHPTGPARAADPPQRFGTDRGRERTPQTRSPNRALSPTPGLVSTRAAPNRAGTVPAPRAAPPVSPSRPANASPPARVPIPPVRIAPPPATIHPAPPRYTAPPRASAPPPRAPSPPPRNDKRGPR